MLTYNVKVPQNYKDPIFKYYGQSFEGYSFLVNPKKLLLERKNYWREKYKHGLSERKHTSHIL